MAAPKMISRREQNRHALTGQLTGSWVTPDGSGINVIPVDVSLHGLGVLMNPCPTAGSQVLWYLPKQTNPLRFEVMWSISQEEHDYAAIINMRRCGLRLANPDQDLIALCAQMPGVEIIQ